MRVENVKARDYYIEEAIAQNWSTRALERQINSFYYERIVSSKNKKKVSDEAKKKQMSLLFYLKILLKILMSWSFSIFLLQSQEYLH